MVPEIEQEENPLLRKQVVSKNKYILIPLHCSLSSYVQLNTYLCALLKEQNEVFSAEAPPGGAVACCVVPHRMIKIQKSARNTADIDNIK